jgi:hypothetical protein
MPKTNARKNVHKKKKAKLRLRVWDLKESLQAPPKSAPKSKRAAAATPAK